MDENNKKIELSEWNLELRDNRWEDWPLKSAVTVSAEVQREIGGTPERAFEYPPK